VTDLAYSPTLYIISQYMLIFGFYYLYKYEIEEALDEQFKRQQKVPSGPEEKLHLENEANEGHTVVALKQRNSPNHRLP